MSSQEPGWIAVVGWNEYLHYSDRAPVWIKLPVRLMSEDATEGLSAARFGIFCRILLEYAQSSSRLRAETSQLTRRLNARVRQDDLESLSNAGLIRIVASASLAVRYHDASPRAFAVEKRREEKDIQPKDVNQGTKERPQEDIERTTGNGRLDALLPAPDPHVTALSAARARIGKEMP